MKRKFRFFILPTILLCGLAIHYMFITIILNDNPIIKFWKEIVIIILLIDTILPYLLGKNKWRFYLDYTDIAFLIFTTCLLVSSVIMTHSLFNAIFVMRRYLMPILVYSIVKNNSRFTKNAVGKIVKSTLVFYSTIALWGIIQALVLGDKFLINLGYPLKYAGRLRDSYYFGNFGHFQRVVSTFSNVNVFGAVIGVLLIVVILNPTFVEKFKGKKYYLFFLTLAFILTFSRSNWLAMILILVISNMRNIRNMRNKINKQVFKNMFLFLLLFSFIILIYKFSSGVNIFSMFYQYIANTVTMKENSSMGRFGIWAKAFSIFIRNPFGIGLGKVGIVNAKLSGDISIVGESSYFAILLDTGIQGALSYFAALILNFYSTMKYKYESDNVNNYLKTVRYVTIYLMIMFIFSNHIYDLEIMITVFFFIGLGRNKKFLNSFNEI